MVLIVVDNSTTGMTGHQGNPGSGLTLSGTESNRIDIEAVVRALGVEEVSTVPSTERDELESAIKRAVKSGKPAVVIAETPCVFVSSYPREAYRVLDELVPSPNLTATFCSAWFVVGVATTFSLSRF